MRFCVVVQGILPKLRRSLSDSPCGVVYASGNLPSSGCNGQRLPAARQCDRAVEHLLGVHVAGQHLEVGQQRGRTSGSSPGQVDAIQPSATPASTRVSARSSRADSSFSRYSTRRSFDGEH